MQLSFTGVTQCYLDIDEEDFRGQTPESIMDDLYTMLSEEFMEVDFEEEDVALEAESIISALKEADEAEQAANEAEGFVSPPEVPDDDAESE